MAVVMIGQTGGPAQPTQGEMRRFIVRGRVDGSSTYYNAGSTDSNRVFKIKAGWLVSQVWGRMKTPAGTYGTVQFMDSVGVTYGATFGATALAGVMYGGGIASGNSKAYTSDDYIAATFGATFGGILDVFADVIDMNPYTSPSATWAANNIS